jgi:outer membrane murein-binding lipoprotein Lpp
MASPKSLIFQLHRHWDIIETLCRQSRELPAFEPPHLLAVIERFTGNDDPTEPAAILRSLCAADLLQPLSRTDDWQINPLVLDFVRGLTHEHELGLSAVLKARVEAVREATTLLAAGVDQQDMDNVRTGAARLSDLIRQITRQLDADRHAILELAEKAKGSDAAMPIARRYRAVLDAYDHYVEPMNEMMDSGLGGTFYPHLKLAVQTLDRAEESLAIRGALYTQRMQLRQVAQQAKELRRLGRLVAQQCSDTLLPLREEARQHNVLSSAIGTLLGRVRKRGLKAALRSAPGTDTMPGWQRERRSLVHLGDEVRTLMADALRFEPKVQTFPEALTGDPADLSDWVDEPRLKQTLARALPVDNLLLWLKHHHPQLRDASLLRLYHELVREPGWQAHLQAEEIRTPLQSVRVSYYPHRLEAETLPQGEVSNDASH